MAGKETKRGDGCVDARTTEDGSCAIMRKRAVWRATSKTSITRLRQISRGRQVLGLDYAKESFRPSIRGTRTGVHGDLVSGHLACWLNIESTMWTKAS
jgi:hypothetical protein